MSLSQIVKSLRSHPLKPLPYPDGYPEDLKFDLYPGKDYVVGVCEEEVGRGMRLVATSKNKTVKSMAQMHVDLFKDILKERQKKLLTA